MLNYNRQSLLDLLKNSMKCTYKRQGNLRKKFIDYTRIISEMLSWPGKRNAVDYLTRL